jgi:hypothetical protein
MSFPLGRRNRVMNVAFLVILSSAVLLLLHVSTIVVVVANDDFFECYTDTDCQNDGKCIMDEVEDITHTNDGGSFAGYCQCTMGYRTHADCSGPYCPKECNNGGSCIVHSVEHDNTLLSTDYECECRNGWKGDMCEMPYVLCPDNQTQCINGATCQIADGDEDDVSIEYRCVCTGGNQNNEFCAEIQEVENEAQRNDDQGSGDGLSKGGTASIVVVLCVGLVVASMVCFRSRTRRSPMGKDPAKVQSTTEGGTAEGATRALHNSWTDEDEIKQNTELV